MKNINLNSISLNDVPYISPFAQFINTTSTIVYIINIILAIVSIILIIIAFSKKSNLKHFSKWILLLILSILINYIPNMMFSYSIVLDSNQTFIEKYGTIIFRLITLLIRSFLIAYPIITIKKNKHFNTK